jgi:DNA polymerase III delta prime subunit
LPEQDIIQFLTKIVTSEKMNVSSNSIIQIQQLYKSDIRSMINFLQSTNSHADINIDHHLNIINNGVWDILYSQLEKREKLDNIISYIHEISITYNIDKKNIIKDYLNYIIRNKSHIITNDFLLFVENIMHYQDCKNTHYIKYALSRLPSFTPLKI